jgi:hypothetical protein
MERSRKTTKNLAWDAVGLAQFGTGYISITSLGRSRYMSEKRIKKEERLIRKEGKGKKSVIKGIKNTRIKITKEKPWA